MKTIWIYVLVAVALGAGGWLAVTHREAALVQPSAHSSGPIDQSDGKSANAAEDINKRRQEGIGSIKNLKPVEIGASSTDRSKRGQ